MKAIIVGMVGLAVFIFAGADIEQALSAFLFAGIIPGTSLQLPWYVILLVAPLSLYALYQLLVSLFTKNLPRKTAISRAPVARSKKKTASRLQKILKDKRVKHFVSGAKKLLHKWHHALEPQLQLLQQKLIALTRRGRRGTL